MVKGLFLGQCEALDRRFHHDRTILACVVTTCMKRRTLSMIIDVKLQVDLAKAFVFARALRLLQK